MKSAIWAAAVAAGLTLSPAQADDAQKSDTMKKQDAMKKSDTSMKSANVTMMPARELTWTELPDAQGVKTAVVEGDSKKGAHHAFIKFPAGFSAPMHHHSADHFVTVIEGTLTFTVEGKDYKLPAGSYFSFAQKAKHATRCESGSDCVLFIDMRGAWDIVPEKATKASR